MKVKFSTFFRNFYQFFAGQAASNKTNMTFPRKKEWDEALRHL